MNRPLSDNRALTLGSRHSRLAAGLVAVLAALSLIGAAADPAERLADPAKEAHARALFAQVRCVVCQNESIDDSEADLAKDLRRSIRDQIVQGRDDSQIRSFLVARYGEFILMKPRFSLGNSLLWLTPFAIVIAGLMVFVVGARRPRTEVEIQDLDPTEQARLKALADK